MPEFHQKLASLRRSDPSSLSTDPRPRRKSCRDRATALLPWALAIGFIALFLIVLGDRLLPARELDVARVVALPTAAAAPQELAGVDPFDGPLLFQASGWIEPDPYPIKATALINGVVREVQVLEGTTVEKGQLLATLIDEDAELDLDTAKSELVSLRAIAEAQSEAVAVLVAENATLEKQIAAAEAKRAELEDPVNRFDAVSASGSGAVSEREVSLARLQLATQIAEIAALRGKQKELAARLRQQEAMVREHEGRCAAAATEVARRKLDLERTRILSPIDGIVLRLLAMPGQKRMLAMDEEDSSTIAILYDPEHLQARIDVPLAEAAKLSLDQPVRIRSSLLPDAGFRGRVTRIAGEADLQRNTLQAKVRIDDPDPRLRPEMLCRGEFLAPVAESGTANSSPASPGRDLSLFVPESALVGQQGETAKVWKIDASGDAVVPVTVTTGHEQRDGHRLVLDGLQAGDRVVLDPPSDLAAGTRVRTRKPSETP